MLAPLWRLDPRRSGPPVLESDHGPIMGRKRHAGSPAAADDAMVPTYDAGASAARARAELLARARSSVQTRTRPAHVEARAWGLLPVVNF